MAVVNDAPTLDLDADNSSGATGADYQRTYTENAAPRLIIDPTDATLADIDSANLAWLTVTITNQLDGTAELLSANTAGTGVTASYNPGTGVLTLNGADTVANYQQVLRTVRYENLSDAPSLAPRVITFVASDDGVQASNTATSTVTISPVNDGPTADIALAFYSAIENSTLALAGTGISVDDVDAGSSPVTVTLSVISGLLTATAGGTGVVVTNSGTPWLTLSGTVAQINDLLDGLSGATLDYIVASDSPPPTDDLNLWIDDNGATGAGVPLGAGDWALINVTAVNDAPVITLPGFATTAEDTPLVFAGASQISITDVDAGGAPVEVTLNVSTGVLNLSGTTGLGFSAGANGTATMTFAGTVADINTALNGLTFMPNANFSGAAFLTLGVNDQGNTGVGGALSDGPELAMITVTPVNDLPSGATNAISMPQDTSRPFGVADFGFTDVDAGDTMIAVRIGTLSIPPGATLQLSGANVTTGQV
ncbi:MAG: hypothetical protein ACREQL_08030, partial [Candidatus Binatia bacterium]